MRGCGSKLIRPRGAPIARAAAAVSAMTFWWPWCTPSKLPNATAAPLSAGVRPFQL